ncbi:receptor homology region, transmembrane domain- and RING domain-containing protein 1-like isoform X2 [Malus domestica]|uniref:receptor homology region, transmembrane domain- and RING domain-containing protein 1-like isoform X2 n=2 Tax=Malus TaxID=3749 RepID=UPI0039767EAF
MMINSKNVTIRSVFVSKASGEMLKEHARGEEGECCIFLLPNEKAWLVFAVSLISFLTVLGLLIIANCARRDWRWPYSQGRNQLPKSADTKIVDALPCFTFSSAGLDECHTEETCAICLENYKDSEILKVLPCQHEFHSSCVDSWLRKWGRNCPVCKHDIRKKIATAEIKRKSWLYN